MIIKIGKLKTTSQKQKPNAMTDWKFDSFIEVDKEYRVEGLNIWNHYWHCSERKVEVKGPFEGQVYYFKEYCIETPEKKVNFVAGEFINGQIGIYLKDDLRDKNL